MKKARIGRFGTALFLTLVACTLAGFITWQAKNPGVGKQQDASVTVPTNQKLTPAGKVRLLEGVRPKDIALSPDGKTLAVLTTGKVVLLNAQLEFRGEVDLAAAPLGLAWSPEGRLLYASQETGKICRLEMKGGKWTKGADFTVEAAADGQKPPEGNPQANGLAISPDGKRLYVALGVRNRVSILALPEMRVQKMMRVGIAPYQLVLSRDGKTLIVANRGGSRISARAKDTALSAGTAVRIDHATDAVAGGSISIVDTRTTNVEEIAVGRQPSAIAFAANDSTAYVANADDDTLSVVDVRSRRVRRTLVVRPPEDQGFGQIPTDVVTTAKGNTMFVSCGGGNAIAVFQNERLAGFLPTEWFPIALAERQGTLYVANAKGIGASQAPTEKGFTVWNSIGSV